MLGHTSCYTIMYSQINTIQNKFLFQIAIKYSFNSRPRKCLDYATPYEAFMEFTGLDATILVKGIRL